MKKALLWIVGILAALCIIVACVWSGEIASICSITAVGNPHSKSRWRYETAGKYLEEHDGTLYLRSWRDYETTHIFNL